MKRTLRSMAEQLSESDIQEIIRIKKMSGKKMIAIRKKRDKTAAILAKLDAQLAGLTGEATADAAAGESPKRRPGRAGRSKGKGLPKGRGKAKKIANEAPLARAGKKATPGGKRKPGRHGISAAVREVFRRANKPLKASHIVDGLPMAGFPVDDVADMRRRISVLLASQKNHFEHIERGIYQLKD